MTIQANKSHFGSSTWKLSNFYSIFGPEFWDHETFAKRLAFSLNEENSPTAFQSFR
jgi:hypothetical protein